MEEEVRKMGELKEYEAVKKWNSRLSVSSKAMRMSHLRKLMEYLHDGNSKFKDFSPDQLVKYQRNAISYARYDILDQIQAWSKAMESATHLDGTSKYRTGYIGQVYATIRGFFAHNRCELPRDKGFTTTGEVPPVLGMLTIEEIKTVVQYVKPIYKAVFLCLFQSGMDQASFKYWSENGYKTLIEALKEDPKVIKIDFPNRPKIRKKVEKPFHTYIGTDAIDALKRWLEIRPDDTTDIFTNQFKRQLKNSSLRGTWQYSLKKLGIIKMKRQGYTGNRYGKNIHEMRDVFRSVWEKTPANKNVVEFMMGHTIDPLNYNKACRDTDWTEQEYLKALPWLNIMSGGAEMKAVEDELIEKDTRIEELEAEIARLKESPVDKEELFEELLARLKKDLNKEE